MVKEWTSREIVELSGTYWSCRALQVAVVLDLFTALHDGPKNEAALAGELGCEERAFAMLTGALAALGFVQRSDGMLRASDSALIYLSQKSPEYLGFIIKHHANIMPAWTRLEQAVRTGRSTAERRSIDAEDPAEREAFLMGMFNIARLQADRIAGGLDLSGRERLIDIGGGPGTYAIHFCLKNPKLKATVFDLPSTRPYAEKTIARFGLSDRIDFHAGDFTGKIPEDYDVAWLSQVLHGESPESAATVVKNAASCLRPGGLLLVQEFLMNDDRSGPAHAALFSLNMLVQTPGGQAYSGAEVSEMFRQAGAGNIRKLDMDLPQSCAIVMGDMPRA